jgi:Fe-S-cluster containining protein
MDIDFSPFFKQYEALVRIAGDAFERVQSDYPECVKCKIGCSDCCNALFDITLIEAIYINHHFKIQFDAAIRAPLIEKANRIDRKIYKIKRKAYRAAAAGTKEDAVLSAMAKERIRCPLLNNQEMCDLYDFRPITCRLYGIPTAINGRGHTCGLTGFKEGDAYPTVQMDTFYHKLYRISLEMIKGIRSRHIKMADMIVPVSMALLSEYDEEYLGIGNAEDNDQEKRRK